MISIIIPTRNRPGDLTECLKGIALQTTLSLITEVIVVDDNSREPYPEVVAAFGARTATPVRWLANETAGAASARNLAARTATGAIFGFLDDDAIPALDWAETVARHLSMPEACAVTGSISALDGERLFSQARQVRYERRATSSLREGGIVRYLAGGNFAITQAWYKRTGGFDERFVMMHDQDLALRLLVLGGSCTFIEAMAIRHRHFKGFRNAFTQTFRSAAWRVLLEREHASVTPLTFVSQLRSWRSLVEMGVAGRRIPVFTAMVLEGIHAVGYVWYRWATR